MIFKQVGDGRPYPDHARSTRQWADVPPRPVRLDQLLHRALRAALQQRPVLHARVIELD